MTPLEENMHKTAKNINAGKDQEDIEIQHAYDSATRNNDRKKAKEAEAMAQAKVNERNSAFISNPDDDVSIFAATNRESRKNAINNVKNAAKDYKVDDTIVNDARKKQAQAENTYKADIDNIATTFDQMNQATAAANASDLSNEIATHDITTPEGRKTIQNYINTYEEMLGPKYEEYSKSYNRALMFNAVQNGLAAAFGIPAIDFTQHPDVTSVKAQLDDMKAFLKEEKTTAGQYGKIKLEKGISDREKNADQQQKLKLEKLAIDKANVDSARQIADGTELGTNILNTNMNRKVKEDIYGLDTADARIEEAKLQGRGAKASEHGAMTWGESAMDKTSGILNDIVKKIGGK